jgi:hypothetical protein
MRHTGKALAALALLYAAATVYRIYDRQYYRWMPDYFRWAPTAGQRPQSPVHVLFYFTDHFEPAEHRDRVLQWEREYPKLANRHRDSAGRPLQHGWFFPGEQPNDEYMQKLHGLVAAGYGEVELHYHHFNDTDDSVRAKYQTAITWFQQFGFLKTLGGETRFAFIHGNWALDNSVPGMCGSNHELRVLHDLGGFADYTFPAIWTAAQPAMVNAIYEAVDDDRPKSYNRGERIRVGREPVGDLMILEGPLRIVPSTHITHLFWDVEDGNIHHGVPLTERRVDNWIKANVHVEGRPDWIFVKVHGHMAETQQEVDDMFNGPFDRALYYLERRYNDGKNYILHYVTAREAYNIARAAAADRTGDPGQYLDYVIPPYVADGPRPEAVSRVQGAGVAR